MKVLLAYDGLERSRSVLEEAASMAPDINRAVLITVVSSAGVAMRSDGPAELTAGGSAWEGQPVEQALVDAQAFLREHGVEADVVLRHGDPVKVIAAELSEGGHDLLLVGTRHGETLDQMLLGNVSERLAELAPCPVLVVGDMWRVRVERRTPIGEELRQPVRVTGLGGPSCLTSR